MAAESRASWDRMQMTEPGFNRMHIGWQPSGSLLLAADPTEAGQLLARQELLSKAGISARYLDQAALHEEEPALHDSVADGLLVSSDAQLVRDCLLLQNMLYMRLRDTLLRTKLGRVILDHSHLAETLVPDILRCKIGVCSRI